MKSSNFSVGKKDSAQNSAIISLYRKIQEETNFQIFKNDPRVKDDLRASVPFLNASLEDPVRYCYLEYMRFMKMSEMGHFQLIPTWSSEQGKSICSVALSMPGQPTIEETGRADAWVCYNASPTKTNPYLTYF